MPHYIIEQVFGPDEPLPPSRGAVPPGLLISLGDGSAYEVTAEILARLLYNSAQEAAPNDTGFYKRWPHLPDELKAPYLTRAHGILEAAVDALNDPWEEHAIIQQAQEKR